MEPIDTAPGKGATARPTRALRRTRLVVVVVTVGVGLAASVLAWVLADRNAESRQSSAARSITGAARSTAENAIAGLGGAPALVDAQGQVSPIAFAAFQHDVDADSSLDALAYVPVVPAGGRADFEAGTGHEIFDRVGAQFARAPDRPQYWPVRLIGPPDTADLVAALVGLDIAADPLTERPAAQARDTGRTTVTEAVDLPSGPSLFFIIKPIYRLGAPIDTTEQRRASHAGFIASAYSGAQLARSVRRELPEDVRFAVRDGATTLSASSPPPKGGVTSDFVVGGRTLSTQVQDARPVNHEMTWFLLGITAVIVGGLFVLMRRSSRYERDIARTTTLISRTADLAQHLAGAATADQVASVIGDHVPPIFGAQGASFGTVDRDQGLVHVHHGPDVDPEFASRNGNYPLDRRAPVTTTVRTGTMTLVHGPADWRGAADDDVAAAFAAAGIQAHASIPLESDDGSVVATVGVSWGRPQRFDEITLATLQTVAELCEQSLARARFTDLVSARASDLAKLAELLAGADTISRAASIITSHGRQPVGASAASIGISDEQAGVLRVHHGDTVSDTMLRRYASPPLDASLAFTDAARTGDVILIGDFETYQQRYPETDPANAELGAGARAAFPLRAEDRTIGSIVFAWDGPRTFDDALVFSLSTVAEMAAQTVQRARLTEAQAEDARHSRELARLAQGLAGRSHTDDITDFLTESVLDPLDATHAVVGMIQGDDLVRSFSRELAAVDRPDLATEFESTPLDEPTPLTDAARTGENVLMANVEALDRRYPGLAGLWQQIGFRAIAALAIRDRTGRVVGSLGAIWDHPVVFADDLRDRLTTVAGIVGQTLERAKLSDELRDSANRNELLADFAQHLAQIRTVDELCDAVVEQAGLSVGAVVANIGLVDDVHQRLEVRPHQFFESDDVQRVGDRSLDASLPGTDAVRDRRSILLGSPEELAERYPGRVTDGTTAAGFQSIAHLPLIGPDGSPLGTLGFAWSAPQAFSPTTRATLRTLAELCSQSLERTRLGESEHRLVESLQHRVVTPLPGAPGITIAQRYLPAAQQVGMGGDWYEGIVLDDSRYALVVGDIAGHGINAIADMIQLRAIIGSLLRSTTPLDEVFPRVASLLRQGRSGLTATSCVSVIDTRSHLLRYVSAGHPPPVLRSPDGQVTLLDGGRQPLLGVPSRIVSPGTAQFTPGSVLITYTDGIIEQRREPIDDSIGRLVEAVRGATTSDLEAMADSLIKRCLQDRAPEDDVALVLVARD